MVLGFGERTARAALMRGNRGAADPAACPKHCGDGAPGLGSGQGNFARGGTTFVRAVGIDCSMPKFTIEKIVSGGQTGADRAGLDAAIALGIPHGGWCPRGRRAEDGRIPDRYLLTETPGANYLQRTEWNVRDSDGTVVFTLARRVGGGSLRTLVFAERHDKPCIPIARDAGGDAVQLLRDFIAGHGIRALNVAGSRESKKPGIGAWVGEVLRGALGGA